MTRLARRVLLTMAIAAAAVAGWAMPAFAHAQLQSTDPASATVLARSPGTVTLHFSEDVEIQFGAVRVFDSGSRRVDSGNAYHPHGDGHAVAIDVSPNLPGGGYVVTWRVISADSHPVHGAFTFLIGSGGATSATAARIEAARLLAGSGGSRVVGVLFGIVRFGSFLSLFVLVGGAAFLVGAWPGGRGDRRAQGLLLAGLIGAILCTALAIGLQGAYGGGLPLVKAFSPRVIREVVGTRFGEVYLARLVILVLAAAPLVRRLFDPAPLPRWLPAVGATAGIALLLTPGLAGHAAAGSLVALALPFDLVHVAAAAIWIGGLSMLGAAVLVHRSDKEQASPLSTIVPRYSQWALGTVLAIAVSGGFAAWRQVGSVSAVTTTPFGRLVLAKTIIFAVLVCVATKSRRLTHGRLAIPFVAARPPRPGVPLVVGHVGHDAAGTTESETAATTAAEVAAPVHAARAAASTRPVAATATATATARKRATWTEASARRTRPVRRRTKAQRQSDLRTSVLVELVLAAAAVAVAAVLVNVQPSRQVLSQPFSAEVHAGPSVLVDVVVDPAKAGPVAIHLYTLSPDGAQLDVPEVTASMSLPSAGITNLAVPLQRGGTGHFLVGGFQVPLRGTWTLSIAVRTTAFDEFNATPVKVRMR